MFKQAALLTLAVVFTPLLQAQQNIGYGGEPGVFTPETCRNSMSPQQEIAEGDKVVAEVYKQMPVLPDDNPVSEYVERIGERLVAVAPLTPGLEQQWPFRFHVVASKEINAFALPGGTMFINLGAIQAAETEAQLAGVMAHEMSHVILRHSTCNLVKQQHRSILYGIGSIASGVLLGGGALGGLAQTGIGFGQNLDFLHMSRGDEQQADLLGVQIERNAGYDPRGLPQFFEIIQAKAGSGGAQFLSDHPNPGNRTQYVNDEIAALPPLARPVGNTDEYRRIRRMAEGMTTYDGKQIQAGAWKSAGLYAAGPGARSQGQVSYAPVSDNGRTPLSAAPAAQDVPAPRPETIAPLTTEELGLNASLQRYQAPLFSLEKPKGWIATPDAQNGTVVLAPPGGNGSFGLAYGVLAGVQQTQAQGIHDAASLKVQTLRFANGLVRRNALQIVGTMGALTVGGQNAATQEMTGTSPAAVSGKQLQEHDWLVTVQRPDGDMDYFLFVCPAKDWAQLQPLFMRMRDSIHVQ